MKKLALLLVVVLLASMVVMAQEQKASVFGGYQLLNFDTKDSGIGRQTAHGWNSDVAFNVHKNVALVADIGGNYKTIDTTKMHAYNFLFGPRFMVNSGKVTPFAEFLFGAGRISGSDSGFSASSTGYAFAFGGGLDVSASKHVAVRLAKFDYVRNHFGSSDIFTGDVSLNNFRYATGIVFKF